MHVVLGFAIAAVAVLIAGVIGWRLRGPGEARVAAAEAPLHIRSDRERATVDLGDATIASDPASAFTVTRPDGGVLVALARGRVELEVQKRGDRAPLVVRAGDTDVIVVGTHFSVDYGDGRGDVDVRVTEGVVRVVHKQKETRLAAGQAWTTRRGLVAIAELERLAAVQAPGAGG
ncbi:MAG: FecR domain-containing protein, partial [Deltaproteobacteria bacterium]|nr:FecR domain-containing protein [Deltaproteobacteria bacterium]